MIQYKQKKQAKTQRSAKKKSDEVKKSRLTQKEMKVTVDREQETE